MKLLNGKIRKKTRFKILCAILLTHILAFTIGFYIARPPKHISNVIVANTNNCVNIEGNIFCAR